MDKRICLITGANSVIGRASTIQIAQNGYHVIIACRDSLRGEMAVKEVKEKSRSNSDELMIVDMSLQSSIKKLGKTFLAKYDTLDVLIHNAATFDISEKLFIFPI